MPKAQAVTSSPGVEVDEKGRVTEILARKKKNADAQAAFRQRRATYISSLEETVVSLESVVVQLQDACREAKADETTAKQELARLKQQYRERERMWRALWQAQRGAPLPEGLPPVPEGIYVDTSSAAAQTGTSSAHPSPTLTAAYPDDRTRYATTTDQTTTYSNGSYTHQGYSTQTTPNMQQYSSTPTHVSSDPRQQQYQTAQATKYSSYNGYMMPGAQRPDGAWSGYGATPSQDSGNGGSTNTSHSPATYTDPSATTLYNNSRYLDGASYVMDQSPTVSAPSTPSTTSTTLTGTGYQFGAFTDPTAATTTPTGDRPDLYRRATNGHGAGVQLTLHGGTADISAALAGGRRPGDAPLLPVLPSLSAPTGAGTRSPVQERPQSTRGGSSSKSHETPSRSPSPSQDPPISGTLAVIKAQAFGTTRRNHRARTKKSAGHAKVAIEALEARAADLGLQLGGVVKKPNKRPRLDSDDELQS